MTLLNQKELYRLPSFSRMTFRSFVARASILYLFALAGVSWVLTQGLAWYYGYPDEFGEPYFPYNPALFFPGLALAGGLLACSLLIAVFAADKKPALFFSFLAPLAAAAAVAPIYQPLGFFLWLSAYREYPDLVAQWRLLQVAFWVIAVVGLVALVIYLAVKARGFREKAHTQGSAAWASGKDIEEAGLFARSGIILGLARDPKKRVRYIRSEGPHHVFVQGPPRSGKGVGIVQPTLLTWPGSVIVHDAKGELWSTTAGWRAQELGSVCIRLDPTCPDKTAARYNPLLEIRKGPQEVADAQNLCDLLVDPQGAGDEAGGAEQHFRDSAAELLLAAILHILYAERDKTLSGLVYFLSHPERSKAQILDRMAQAIHDERAPWTDPDSKEEVETHPLVASIARGLKNREERELSGVFSTALTKLQVYRDPIVAKNVAASDFALEDLMDHERPVSLYMTVPPSDVERARPLMRLFLAQALRRLTQELELELEGGRAVSKYRHELLLMLDEFPLLGRLHFFEKALAVMPGYGIRACLITQGLSQHRAIYAVRGRHESIVTTCDVRVALAANDYESAKYFSDLCGVFTVHQETRSYRGGRVDLLLNKQYVAQKESQRPLVYPDEILRLPDDDILILARSVRPIRAQRVKRYEDGALNRRSGIPAPLVSDVLERGAGAWEERLPAVPQGPPAA